MLWLVWSSPFIDHNTIRHGYHHGIQATGDCAPIVSNNVLTDNGVAGPPWPSAMYLHCYLSSIGLIVSGNTVGDNGWEGIWLDSPGVNVVDSNIISNNPGTGIIGGSVLVGNTLINNGTGIYGSGAPLLFADNTVSGNKYRGIHATGTGLIAGNTITNNGGRGIEAHSESEEGIEIDRNTITGNRGHNRGRHSR